MGYFFVSMVLMGENDLKQQSFKQEVSWKTLRQKLDFASFLF